MTSSQSQTLQILINYYTRTHFEHQFNIKIPLDLKKIIQKFARRYIPSILLTVEEDYAFMQLLLSNKSKQFENKHFNLIFQASKDGYLAKDFHSKCDNKGATIIIIKSDHGNIFGGYTSIPWSDGREWKRDDNAFLFVIRSNNYNENDSDEMDVKYPKIFDATIRDYAAVVHLTNTGPTFGSGYDLKIADKCNEYQFKEKFDDGQFDGGDSCYTFVSSNGYHHNNELCGGNKIDFIHRHLFCVVDYQVFQVL